jgi:hypothetical protein
MAKTKSRGYTKKRSLKKSNTRKVRKPRSRTRKSMNLYYGGESDKIAKFQKKLNKFIKVVATPLIMSRIRIQHKLAHKFIMFDNKMLKILDTLEDIRDKAKLKKIYFDDFKEQEDVEHFVNEYKKKYWDFDDEDDFGSDVPRFANEYDTYVENRDHQYDAYIVTMGGDEYIDSIGGESNLNWKKFQDSVTRRNINFAIGMYDDDSDA